MLQPISTGAVSSFSNTPLVSFAGISAKVISAVQGVFSAIGSFFMTGVNFLSNGAGLLGSAAFAHPIAATGIGAALVGTAILCRAGYNKWVVPAPAQKAPVKTDAAPQTQQTSVDQSEQKADD